MLTKILWYSAPVAEKKISYYDLRALTHKIAFLRAPSHMRREQRSQNTPYFASEVPQSPSRTAQSRP